MRPQDVIEWWRGGRAKVVEPLSHMNGEDRIEWIAGDMSARTFATFRLMETWMHGLDIYSTLGLEVEDTPRNPPHLLAWMEDPSLRLQGGRRRL